MNTEYKKCKICGEVKPVEEYYKDNRLYKGKQYYLANCKCCHREKAHLNYLKNKDQIHLSQKKYYEKNKVKILERNREYFSRKKEFMKIYRAENKERIKTKNREWIAKNKEWVNEYQRALYYKNSDHRKAQSKEYRKSSDYRFKKSLNGFFGARVSQISENEKEMYVAIRIYKLLSKGIITNEQAKYYSENLGRGIIKEVFQHNLLKVNNG